ncbi:hypothetical protein TWF730_008105 [Orbilia blumenaviensis]|uniref:Uncharacterized protein n=1 Tax=Orbilia blumenaviensis TaxID=1796055 RepID=A0AAV9V9W9_9PEZI
MSRKPTFFLLNEGHFISIDLGPRILGALCERMEDPMSCWKPNNAASVFSSKFAADDQAHTPQMRIENNAKVEINKQKSKELGGILQGLLQIMWAKATNETYRIDSQLIRTVRLPQHEDMFDALLEDESVQNFRRARKNDRYFMITGYKSCLNGLVTRTRTRNTGPEIEIDVPFELLLTSLGVPAPPGLFPEIGFKDTWTTTVESLSEYFVRGEQIFAVEYREILRYSKIANILSSRKKEKERRLILSKRYGHPEGDAAYAPERRPMDVYLNLPIPVPHEYCAQSVEVDDDDGPYLLGMKVDPTAREASNDDWLFIE